jgi:hypothetical protein
MERPPVQNVQCRCCGVVTAPTQTLQGLVPSCIRCTGHWACAIRCGGIHGEALEREARQLVKNGVWQPWYAVALCAVDDAQICNRLLLELGAGHVPPVQMFVPDPPRRWEVVACRSLVQGQVPAAEDVMAACLEPFFGRDNTESTRMEIRREIADAMRCVVGEVVDVDIEVMPEPGHSGGFIANIVARVPTTGEELQVPTGPAPAGGEESAVDALAKVLPFRGRAEA